MDVEELLNYTPAKSMDDEIEDRENNQNLISKKAKKRKMETQEEAFNDSINDSLNISSNDAPNDSLNADSLPSELDEMQMKRLLLHFERKVLKNQELRIKFAENPTKFMDSEIELFDMIQEMHVISTQPELYHIMVDLNVVPTLLGLLSHENTDIACAVVAFLQELSDLDDVQELDHVRVLLDALINGQVIAQLVANMERLDETVKEEAEGVYNSLGIFIAIKKVSSKI